MRLLVATPNQRRDRSVFILRNIRECYLLFIIILFGTGPRTRTLIRGFGDRHSTIELNRYIGTFGGT